MKVTIHQAGLPDGYEISLTGLPCILINNEEVDVPDEAVVQYEAATGKKLADVVKGKKFKAAKATKSVDKDDA